MGILSCAFWHLYVFLGKMSVQSLCLFFVFVVCVFVVELNESLCILDINSLQDIQLVKKPPAMQETWVRSLGWEDPPEKGKATHSGILAWGIP